MNRTMRLSTRGLKLGLYLSFAYNLILSTAILITDGLRVMLFMIPYQIILGIVPSLFIGGLTGFILGLIIHRKYLITIKEISVKLIVIAGLLVALINIPVLLFLHYSNNILWNHYFIYTVLLGLPSIIYVATVIIISNRFTNLLD